ncbi:MAG: hypothetical protein P9M14_05325 [Candidatus Alcyoniella australis]|nr:hypothetical protein [Candidatus Alcyoniella australis]
MALIMIPACSSRDQRSLKRFADEQSALVVIVPQTLEVSQVIDVGVAADALHRRIDYDSRRFIEIFVAEMLQASDVPAHERSEDQQDAPTLRPYDGPPIESTIDRDQYLSLLSRNRAVALVEPLEGDEFQRLWEEPQDVPRGGELLYDEQARVPGPNLAPRVYRIKHRPRSQRGRLGLYCVELIRDNDSSRVYRGLALDKLTQRGRSGFVVVADVLKLELVCGPQGCDLRYCVAAMALDVEHGSLLAFQVIRGSAQGDPSLPGPGLRQIDTVQAAMAGPLQNSLDLLAQRCSAKSAAVVGLLDEEDMKSLARLWAFENLNQLEQLGPPGSREMN